jgi:hypothetical protein
VHEFRALLNKFHQGQESGLTGVNGFAVSEDEEKGLTEFTLVQSSFTTAFSVSFGLIAT